VLGSNVQRINHHTRPVGVTMAHRPEKRKFQNHIVSGRQATLANTSLAKKTFTNQFKKRMSPKHHIRPASSTSQDGPLILSLTDSQLPHLARIGSAEQWGTASIASNAASQEKYKNLVARSEEPQTWGDNNKDWVDVSILEVEVETENLPDEVRGLVTNRSDDEGTCRLPIAAMVLEACSSEYTRPVIPEQDEADPFVYVRFLVSDRRAGGLSKGSGQVLLEHADAVARSLGVGRLVLDGWSGNGGSLVR